MTSVVKIENLYKEYRLGVIGHGTLYKDLQSWWARARGKKDPNSILFSDDPSLYGETKDHILALNDINFTLKRGERLGIIGKNGAGKTTLLKILSRIASPTKGTTKIKGRVASLIAVGTGFHQELTGRENIYLNGSILGLRKLEIDERFDEIVDFSGVEQFIDTPVKRYSSGMYVRLGFAVSVHLDPDVLIVDEVLSVGDAEFREKAISKMKGVEGDLERTILFVSHNMNTIKDLCERTILLEKGKLILDGPTDNVIEEYIGDYDIEDSEDFKPEITFTSNKKTFQIRAVRILDHNNNLSAEIDRSKPFRIGIDYDIHEDTQIVSVEFSLEKSDGTLIYHGADTDLMPDQVIDRKQGNYTKFVEFPGYILNAGNYQIFAFIRWAGTDYDYPDKQPIFRLNDNGTYASGPNVYVVDKRGQRRGVIAMPLPWKSVESS